jgi:hypothetical protein
MLSFELGFKYPVSAEVMKFSLMPNSDVWIRHRGILFYVKCIYLNRIELVHERV